MDKDCVSCLLGFERRSLTLYLLSSVVILGNYKLSYIFFYPLHAFSIILNVLELVVFNPLRAGQTLDVRI